MTPLGQNGTFDPTSIVNVLQSQNALLAKIQQTLAAISTPLTVYAVASLPATAATFTPAWASNGRANAGQGVGAGTGTMVVFNGTTWIAQWSGVAVLA